MVPAADVAGNPAPTVDPSAGDRHETAVEPADPHRRRWTARRRAVRGARIYGR
ncbi:hypothetical protein FRACA_300008 [Frankia canadensis]|uniref:Uncharacterized protein n=1 Tax=Frankia canadensis TaxID=1836972 RepID=A0A2I2KTX6_9ACTN|nr:hypothetical protein FRACA_300008 [Frankia canadensis]SOU56402.1 hypothetical protein FRACA_300008 [Frankia canadensis]